VKFPFDNYTNIATVNGKMCVRGRSANGMPLIYKAGYKPRLYLPCQESHSEASRYRTLDGRPTIEIVTDGIWESRGWIEQTKMHGMEVHGDIQPAYQFLSRAFQNSSGVCPMDRIRIAVLDLEVNDGNGFPHPETVKEPITCITVGVGPIAHTWAYKDYTSTDPTHHFHRCKDEEDMLESFIDWWCRDYPDILTGWNVQFFDVEYLINRVRKLFGDKMARRLSPWKKLTKRDAIVQHRKIVVQDIAGVAILDYLELYKKFSMGQQENYRLDTIASVELGERKLSYAEYSTLGKLYTDNFDLYVKYNLQDVRLVQKLDARKKYLALVMDLAYTAKVNYVDCMKQVRLWDAMIYNELLKDGIVIPPRKDRTKSEKYEGAYVKDVQTGNHAWVVSFDVNSLYPSLMRQWNISPDKLMPIEALQAKLEDVKRARPDVETWALPDKAQPELMHLPIASLSKAQACWLYTALVQTIDVMQAIDVDTCLKREDWLKDAMAAARFLGLVVSPNKQTFKIDSQGFLPRILSRLYDERVKAKNKQIEYEKQLEALPPTDPDIKRLKDEIDRYKIIQTVRKVGLNSAYGALGAAAFRYFDVRQAEAVTLSGKVVIQKVEHNVNNWLNTALGTTGVDYIIGSDTDSIYVRLEQLVAKVPKFDTLPMQKRVDIVNKIAVDKIQPIIDKTFANILTDFGSIDPCLVMKRESIANRGIWAKKKHYILNVYDSEGVRYEKPKLKMVGIEAVKSSTPMVCRKKIKDAIEIIMEKTQEELWALITAFETEFQTMKFEEVAFPRGANNFEKFRTVTTNAITGEEIVSWRSGTPIHIRAALVYNEYLQRQGLDKKGYRFLQSGDKVKFAYLTLPNFLHSNVVATPDGLPQEWNHLQIDFALQFEKTFLNPLRNIIMHAGWKMHEERSMADLWA
jgi:DNA polymerase elongation subunit (family B)